MGFRDDREASVQRIEVLERELAASKNELEAAQLRAAEVDDLRKRMVDLAKERDAMRGPAASRAAATRIGLWAGAIVLCAAGWFVFQSVQRFSGRQAADLAMARGERDRCEVERETLSDQYQRARVELAQIDATNDGEVLALQHQLGDAVRHASGSALLVTAELTGHTGDVPEGVTNDCAMTIRSDTAGTCIATVLCGDTQVFPLAAPPTVRCSTRFARPWAPRGDAPLTTAVALVRGLPPLLAYDADQETLVVRETATGGFELRMHVTGTNTYMLR